jgi:hypothetical protein
MFDVGYGAMSGYDEETNEFSASINQDSSKQLETITLL